MYKFQVYKSIDGQYRWRFIAANGEKICWSEGYTTQANALKSIELVKKYVATAPIT